MIKEWTNFPHLMIMNLLASASALRLNTFSFNWTLHIFRREALHQPTRKYFWQAQFQPPIMPRDSTRMSVCTTLPIITHHQYIFPSSEVRGASHRCIFHLPPPSL